MVLPLETRQYYGTLRVVRPEPLDRAAGVIPQSTGDRVRRQMLDLDRDSGLPCSIVRCRRGRTAGANSCRVRVPAATEVADVTVGDGAVPTVRVSESAGTPLLMSLVSSREAEIATLR